MASTAARTSSWRKRKPSSDSTSKPAVTGAFEVVEDTNGRRVLHGCQEIDVDVRTDRGCGSDRRTCVGERHELSIHGVADRQRDIVVGHGRDHRLEQQGVPAAALVQDARPILARQRTRRRQIERAERQHDLVGDARTASAAGHDDQQATRTVDRPPQPRQRGRLRQVVEVLDDEHRGTRPGEHVEGPQHRPEQLTLATLGARRHRRRCCRMSDPDRRGQRRRLVGRQPVERTGLGHTHGRRDRVGDGCQWKVSAELVAAALGDEHLAAIEVAQPHADERRLSDPGLSLDGDDGRPPTVRIVEEPVQPRQLRAAAREVEPRRRRNGHRDRRFVVE